METQIRTGSVRPVRSEAHLAFVRSLPCLIEGCRSRFTVAMHTSGSRGMGQKRSDLETVPGCPMHHDEQHRMGWKAFALKYDLDIPALIGILTTKPHIRRGELGECYYAVYFDEVFQLSRVEDGLGKAMSVCRDLCREWLIENVFRPIAKAS